MTDGPRWGGVTKRYRAGVRWWAESRFGRGDGWEDALPLDVRERLIQENVAVRAKVRAAEMDGRDREFTWKGVRYHVWVVEDRR